MNHSFRDWLGAEVSGSDGPLGELSDVYFDSTEWEVRYLEIETKEWLSRSVLLSPAAIEPADNGEGMMRMRVSRSQVEGSPALEMGSPERRAQEMEYYTYYGWPGYWTGSGLWGMGETPGVADAYIPPPGATEGDEPSQPYDTPDDNLRSARELVGQSVEARDGHVGSIVDLLIEDGSWRIHHLVVDTTDWMPGGEVIIPPSAVERIDWMESRTILDLARDSVRDGEEYRRGTG